ncbi:MAG TPA: hypothetical protein VFD43_04985 [Planctomycetota bacterium]|nr:hypothetical protein [Planctomycetota bacterium]
MQPHPPPGPGLGALLLAFLAGALGGAAVALLVPSRGRAANGADDAGLRQSVEALDAAVRALGGQVAILGQGAQPPGPPAEPLDVPDAAGAGAAASPDLSALLARLDDVALLLQAQAAAGSSAFAGSLPLPPLDATRGTPDRSALVALALEENDQTRQIWRRHAFWTCQQVLDAYGLPDQIEAGDATMGWYYDTGQRMVHFVFHEGMLINVWN